MGVATKTPREKSAVKKVNKWDIVMSKISEPSKVRIPASQVKSKLIQNLSNKPTPTSSLHVESDVKQTRGHGRSTTGVPSARTLLMDHHDHDRYSVQSSTESESSLQESGPPSGTTRVKKTLTTKHRHPSDLSSTSASDHSGSQRRMPLPSKPVTQSKGASKLALNSTSNTSISTNPPSRIKKKLLPAIASVQSQNLGCKSVPSKISYSRTTVRDRNQRMGPDGKVSEQTDTAEGRVSHLVQSTNNNNSSQNVVVNQTIKQSNNLPLVINPTSNLIDNSNNNTPSSPCNNTGPLTLANSHLKEELSLQYELNANLKIKLDQATSTYNQQKNCMENELKVLNQKFLAMTIIAQNFNVQKSVLEERLLEERRAGQGRENQLATERLEEIQNLRVEFERERECIQEELIVMRKTDEAQVEKLKELGAELSKKEELLQRTTKEFEEGKAELQRKYGEDLEAIRIKYREEAQEDAKYQVLKRTLSSPQPSNLSSDNVLQKEINSLQVVIDMRNQEIRHLGQELLTQKSFSEDLVTCKEQNKGLLAKVEDLKAQLGKSRKDKQELQEKYQVAESQADHTIHQLAQLQLENEQLKWRLQSIRTDERVNEIMSKSAVQLGCDRKHMNLDYESAMSSLLDPGLRIDDLPSPNGCVK